MSCTRRIAPFLWALILVACSGGGGGGGSTPPPPATGIGPAGGTVSGPNGSSVVIPAGALSQNVDIAIAQSAAGAPPLPPGVTPVGDVYAFTPHGTAFAQPATLTVPFNPSQVPSGATLVLYKTNAQQNGWEVVAGASANGSLMSGNVSSFSWVFVGAVVVTAPSIVQQPYNVATVDGGSALFFVVASGAPLSYQWRNNTDGTVISGATGPVLLLRDRNPANHDGDCYVVDISNSAGTVTTNPACLSVTANTYVFDSSNAGAMSDLAETALAAIRAMSPFEWMQSTFGPTISPVMLSPPAGCFHSGSIVGSTLDAVTVTNSGPVPLGTHQASIVQNNCRMSSDDLPSNGALLVDYALTPSYAEGSASIHRGDYNTYLFALGESTQRLVRVHGSVQMSSTRSLNNGDTVHAQQWAVTGGTSMDEWGGSGPVFVVPGATGPETLIYTVTNTAAGATEWEVNFNNFEVIVTAQNGDDVARLFARGTVRWRIESGGVENHSGAVSVYRSLGSLNPVTSVQFVARFIPVGLGGLALDPDQDCTSVCTVPYPF